MLLKHLGAEDCTVNNGEAALEALRTFRPVLALLDIGMPKLDGNEVARLARQRPEGRDVQLVALNGWGQDEDRRKSTEAGFDHHLVKPVEPSALRELLSALPQYEPRMAGKR